MTQIAASIEYEIAPPSAGLPDDMHALPGASLRFLAIKAIDGFKIHAALWQPTNKPPVDTTVIVQVHGGGGTPPYRPSRRRSLYPTDSRRSDLAAGTGLHAPYLPFAILVGTGSVGWKCVIPDLPGPDVRML
jgi:hypothetical protein